MNRDSQENFLPCTLISFQVHRDNSGKYLSAVTCRMYRRVNCTIHKCVGMEIGLKERTRKTCAIDVVTSLVYGWKGAQACLKCINFFSERGKERKRDR